MEAQPPSRKITRRLPALWVAAILALACCGTALAAASSQATAKSNLAGKWVGHYGGAVSGHRADEVALREYADRLHPPILHYQGADAMLSELLDRKFDAVRGVYPHYVMAFGP